MKAACLQVACAAWNLYAESIGTFASFVQPMHAIIALTSLLQEDDSLSKDQKMMVDTIVKSSALLST